ncbi:oligosaccharide flippase family protein [Halosquirtibacter laminarini]|uniref:Oligosaccharide flippase family protein n=1 Tax=Halosquirtibacter laminarini TaxID=3374600 RepID=A0AC61NM24_9BACT|nr:oligosaccharide flippase family protein [Prolixibacteraceae bacterium]
MNKINLLNSDIKKIFKNFSVIGTAHVLNMLIPLIVYPILIRRLGANLYGQVVLVLSVVQYFSLIINFGLNTIGIKDISKCESDDELGDVFCTIYFIRFLLLILCAIIYFTIGFIFINDFRTTPLYFYSFGILLYDSFIPLWFFQGVERVKVMSILILITRLLGAGLVICFVQTKVDHYLIPVCYFIGHIVAIVIGLFIVNKDYNFKPSVPSLQKSLYTIKAGAPLFLSQFSLLLRDRGIVILSGIFFSNTIVAYYDLSSKIVNIYLNFYNQLPIVALPRVIKSKKSVLLFKQLILLTIIIGSIGIFGCLIIGDKVVLFLGSNKMYSSIFLLKIISPLLIITPLNTLLNYYFISIGAQKRVLYYTFFSAVLFLILSCSLLLFKDIKVSIFILILVGVIELFFKSKEFRSSANESR